ncbi:Vacuolar-sorting protein SNF8 [Babesia sp. Xinjiang]|uniref:Vacuolar-sorting protein SNF8 n=1 Tax=Babesia sp. Xinjiang TaxID=462227 RepID=UPI000A262011|nr:Vacuolar-sorting protein SNF8 [Babesia sp. Xinjiang]ORM40519.1 Vacuolar-sorting protein SNF8 [Babesia sp. Xinjiang]
MRRGVGASRILNAKNEQEKWEAFSDSFTREKLETYKRIIEDFKVDLYAFIAKYKEVINADPSFRIEFLEICDLLGVDPLSSSSSALSRTLGLTNYYVEITVRLLEVCIQTRALNGGFCEMDELLAAFPPNLNVTKRDIIRCIEQCPIFGKNSIRILCVRDKTLIVTAPMLLGAEHRECLDFVATVKGGISMVNLSVNLGWTEQRTQSILNQFIERQIVWVDQTDDEMYYWFPCLSKVYSYQI